jgi:hypothetical protein
MACRKISGLKWAKASDRRPFGTPKIGRGAKSYGIRYERAVAKALTGATHGQWFEFEDSNGLGMCQTDFLVLRAGVIGIVEVKYTWTPEAEDQIERLYKPVVSAALGLPVCGLVICKNLTREVPADTVFETFGEALGSAIWWSGGPLPVLHWLGKGPIG